MAKKWKLTHGLCNMENNEKELIKEEKPKRIRTTISNIFTIGLVILTIYVLLGVYNQAKTGELFFLWGYRPVTIVSGSMEPELKTGAIVLAKKTKDIDTDDIVFFETEEGIPVVHRCIGKDENNNLITKGDASNSNDFQPVTEDRIFGKVVFKWNSIAKITRMFIE